jgi:hypothetical protein
MCNKIKCKLVEKNVSKYSVQDIVKQLELCEKCCYKKDIDSQKDKTYLKVRTEYVKVYSENSTLISAIHNKQTFI